MLLGALSGGAGGGFGFASCFGFGAFACLLYLVGYGLVYLAVEVGELALLLADLPAETFLALFETFDLFLFGYLLLVELLALVHDFADEHDHASLGFEIFVLGLHEFALFLHDLLRHVVLVGGVLACVACAAIHLGEVACAEYEDDGGLDFGGLAGDAQGACVFEFLVGELGVELGDLLAELGYLGLDGVHVGFHVAYVGEAVFELYAEVVYVTLALLDVFLGLGEVLLAGFDLLLELGLLGFEGADFLAVLGGEGEGEQQGGEGEQEVSGCHCAGWLEGVILSWS